MWFALLMALVATAGNNIGKVLQKQGVETLPPMALKADVVKAYFTCWVWLIGVSGDILGAVLTAVALAYAPVSVIQPILAAGTAFLALFSHFYLKEKLKHIEWVGVGLSILGAVGMSLTLLKGQDRLLMPQGWVALGVVASLLIVCEVLIRSGRGTELAAGLQAGLCFGFSATFIRGGMLLAQEHKLWLFGAVGVAGSFVLSSSGFFFQTRGLQLGRAMLIGTYTTVFALITAVGVGLFALNEPMPHTLQGHIIRWGSLALIALGVSFMTGPSDTPDTPQQS